MASAERGTAWIREVGRLGAPFLAPRLTLYWLDCGASAGLGYAALALSLAPGASAPAQAAWLTVATFAFYRVSIFIHELAHHRTHEFGRFRWFWNAVFGIPWLVPSFLYGDHRAHHERARYGTAGDAEYFRPSVRALRHLAMALAMPALSVLRFGVLAPAAWVVRAVRPWVWASNSSIYRINPQYRRAPAPGADGRRACLVQEALCFGWIGLVAALVLAGVVPWRVVAHAYAVFSGFFSLNMLRTLGAHRYASRGAAMSLHEQALDSTTIEGIPWLSELWAPLGLRYHALHHLVPALPYHNLHKLHRVLLERLPPDSPYRATLRRSLWHALATLERAPAPGAPMGG